MPGGLLRCLQKGLWGHLKLEPTFAMKSVSNQALDDIHESLQYEELSDAYDLLHKTASDQTAALARFLLHRQAGITEIQLKLTLERNTVTVTPAQSVLDTLVPLLADQWCPDRGPLNVHLELEGFVFDSHLLTSPSSLLEPARDSIVALTLHCLDENGIHFSPPPDDSYYGRPEIDVRCMDNPPGTITLRQNDKFCSQVIRL